MNGIISLDEMDEANETMLEILRNSFGSVTKFNPYHDELGRFTTGGVSSAVADSIIARVKANGGLSVKILTGEEPTDGFMVAQQGHNLEIKEEDFFDAKKGKAALSAYLKAKKLVFGKDQYLGLWWNKDKKEISLDVVDKIKTRSQATKAGRERNQQAIWDVKNQEEINTGGTGDRTTEPTLASSETSKAFGGDDRSGDRGFRVPSLGKFRSGKQRVVQQTIRAKVFKVSFGGDRSEAGRFAANQRWKDHVKTKTAKAPNITKELKTYFGGTQKRYEQSEGWKEVQKRQIRNHTEGQFAEDLRLEIIAEKQGFTGKPKVVSAEEMNQLEKEGWTIAYRGISDAFEEGSDIFEAGRMVKSEDLARQFIEGDYFAGYGAYGNGTYCAILKETAEGYAAQGDTKGTVLKIAIPPDLLMSSEQFAEQVKKKYEKTKIAERTLDFWGDDDLGRNLSAKGFRGARIKSISSPAEIINIWDRSMLAVQELDTTK